MKQSTIQPELNGALETRNAEIITARTSSYQITRLPIANRVLEIVDRLTNGKAGMLQRLFSFLFIGGFGAVINLVIANLLYEKLSLPINAGIHYVIAQTISYEISLLVNFSLNDYFTFRHLEGHARSWFARCSRFHLTAGVGFFLNLIFGFSLHFFLHIPSTIAQAIAIILVLFYNFTAHHFFTYRHTKSATRVLEDAIDEGARELASAMSGSTDAHRAV